MVRTAQDATRDCFSMNAPIVRSRSMSALHGGDVFSKQHVPQRYLRAARFGHSSITSPPRGARHAGLIVGEVRAQPCEQAHVRL